MTPVALPRRGWRVAAAVLAAAVAGACGSSGTNRAAPATTASTVAPTTLPATTTSTVSTTGTTAAPAPAGSGTCGFMAPPHGGYRHVVWIWMENHGYGSVIGSASAPFENRLAAGCGLATNYHNVTHPSLPNYIAATSGLAPGQLGPFYPECDPSASCSAGPAVASIFSQAPTWRAYEESIPRPCDTGSGGEYAARHNPPVYYGALAAGCAAGDVGFGDFAADLASGNLPAFSFVTPNLVDDTHDASVATGDRWLQATVGEITSSAAYRSGTVALFVTWDEGEGGSASACATNTTDAGCHVPAIVVSPSTPPGTQSAALFNHYSLLRTAEDLLGLPPLGQAAGAASMVAAFGL